MTLPVPTPTRCVVNRKIIQVAAGHNHSMILTDKGVVYTAGSNAHCQLGYGIMQITNSFIQVPLEEPIDRITCGNHHCIASTFDGNTIYAWGHNNMHQLGNIENHDKEMVALPSQTQLLDVKIVKIVAGGDHNILMTEDRQVYTFGSNFMGQCGVDSAQNKFLMPQHVQELSNYKIIDIAAGGSHSMALTASGAVLAWGFNFFGQLGLGHYKACRAPQLVPSLGCRVIRICLGSTADHSLLLTETGHAYSTGMNQYGQLGLTDNVNRCTPQVVTFLRR